MAQLALLKCPEGSYTINIIDLDDEYNVYWHRSIEWGIATGSPKSLPGHYVRKYILSRGGWRELNYGRTMSCWLESASTTIFQ